MGEVALKEKYKCKKEDYNADLVIIINSNVNVKRF